MSDAKTALYNTFLQTQSQLNGVAKEKLRNLKLEEDLEVTKEVVVALSPRQRHF